jgi:hypothetical protein
MLDNDFYAGFVGHNGHSYPGAHEPLISQEEWAKYVVKREQSADTAPRSRAPRWALSGIAVCGRCGASLHCLTTNRGYMATLRCSTYQSTGGKSGGCEGVWGSRHRVEAAVLAKLAEYADVGVSRRAAEAARTLSVPRLSANPLRAERRRLEKTVADADSDKERLLFNLSKGFLEGAEYKVAKDRIDAEVAAARKRLAQITIEQVPLPTKPQVRTLISHWEEMEVGARRDVCRALIRRVRVGPGSAIHVSGQWEPDESPN